MTKKRTNSKRLPAMALLLGSMACLVLFTIAGPQSALAKNRKFGLFIGINDYPGEDSDLRGTVNDANGWRNALIKTFKFAPADTTLLLDKQATRQAIINSINQYAVKVGPGDIFVVTYSGHGTLFPDKYSEEIDEKKQTFVDLWIGEDHIQVPSSFYDSAICPVDSDLETSGKTWGNLILDDELFNLFSQFVTKGAKVVFVSDSCHSGTIAKGEIKDIQAKPRFTPVTRFVKPKSQGTLDFATPMVQKKVESRLIGGMYLTMSGSKDNEVSWDYRTPSGKSFGMFTNTALTLLQNKGAKALELSYEDFMNLVSGSVENVTTKDFPTTQTPQLVKEYGNADALLFQP